jgi:hypothetical protein
MSMNRLSRWWWALLAVAAAAPSCTGPNGVEATSTGTTTAPVDLPADAMCRVLDVLRRQCWTCHGTTLHGNAPIALVTRDQLAAPSTANPAQSFAARSAIRMKAASSPMPPGKGPTAAAEDVALLEAWAAAGHPAAECGDGEKDPYAAPAACSGVQLEMHQQEGEDMNPGRACNTCHQQVNNEQGGDAPLFLIAGTVFATAHEPDDCRAPHAQGAEVEITDAHGKVVVLAANEAGNFFYEEADLTFPYTAKVRFEGREIAMAMPQENGACNECHTQAGANDAPGRILLP